MGDSIFRTTATKIELYLDNRARGIQNIRVEWSTDLSTWNTLVLLPGREHGPFDRNGFRNKVYYTFNPADFGIEYPFFLRFIDVSDGVDGDPSDVILFGDPTTSGGGLGSPGGLIEFSGIAPEAADISGSITVSLPSTVVRVRIDNLDQNTVSLMVAFSSTGPEREVGANDFLEWEGPVTSVIVRGVDADCDFAIIITTS